METEIAWTYTGRDGAHYIGVPMRDLTAEEFDALDERCRDLVRAGVLYAPAGAPPAVASEAVEAAEAAPAAPVAAPAETDGAAPATRRARNVN